VLVATALGCVHSIGPRHQDWDSLVHSSRLCGQDQARGGAFGAPATSWRKGERARRTEQWQGPCEGLDREESGRGSSKNFRAAADSEGGQSAAHGGQRPAAGHTAAFRPEHARAGTSSTRCLDACAAELTSRAAQVVEAVSSALDNPGLAALSSVNLATALNRLAKALKARRHLSVFVPPRASCPVRRANTQHAARAMTHPATAGQRGSARGGSAGRPRRGGSGGAGRRRASAGNGGAAAAGAAGV
jgi:hypothetical protein